MTGQMMIRPPALNHLEKIEDINSKDRNSSKKHNPIHVSAREKASKVQN